MNGLQNVPGKFPPLPCETWLSTRLNGHFEQWPKTKFYAAIWDLSKRQFLEIIRVIQFPIRLSPSLRSFVEKVYNEDYSRI